MKLEIVEPNICESQDSVSLVKAWDDYFVNDKYEDEPCDYHGYDIMFNGKRVGSVEIITIITISAMLSA